MQREIALRVVIADKFGRKYTMLTAFVLLFVGITIETVANTTPAPNAVFFAGKFVNGLGVGIQLVTSMVYIGEVSQTRVNPDPVSFPLFACEELQLLREQ